MRKISSLPVPLHAGLKSCAHCILGYVVPPCGQMDAILNVLFVSSFVLLKMPGGGKCVFNSDWVLDGAYKDWLQVVKGDKHAAYCKLCCREFKLASMGKAALKCPRRYQSMKINH